MINDPSWYQIGSWIKQISFSFYFLLPTEISSKKVIIHLKDYKTGNWFKKNPIWDWELIEFNFPTLGIGWKF